MKKIYIEIKSRVISVFFLLFFCNTIFNCIGQTNYEKNCVLDSIIYMDAVVGTQAISCDKTSNQINNDQKPITKFNVVLLKPICLDTASRSPKVKISGAKTIAESSNQKVLIMKSDFSKLDQDTISSYYLGNDLFIIPESDINSAKKGGSHDTK